MMYMVFYKDGSSIDDGDNFATDKEDLRKVLDSYFMRNRSSNIGDLDIFKKVSGFTYTPAASRLVID